MSLGGALAGTGDRLYLRLEHAADRPAVVVQELESYKEFPPLQAPETYNLDGILKQMQEHKGDD